MQCVTCRISRHYHVLNVCLHDHGNRRLDSQNWQLGHKRQPIRRVVERASSELIQYGGTCRKFVAMSCICPSVPCPVAARDDLGSSTSLVVKAGNCRLDVHTRLAHGCSIPRSG